MRILGRSDPLHAGIPRRLSERSQWWITFAVLTAAGLAWVLGAPLGTGPDEVFQARRAAAVVRGQLGGKQIDAGNVVVEVEVPETYLSLGEYGYCFVGDPIWGDSEGWIGTPESTCPDLNNGTSSVPAPTGQHRGQPFYFAAIGLPTLLWTGTFGAYAMRVVGLLLATALLASAAQSIRQSKTPRLAAAAFFGCITPMVLYLAASSNPSGLEIAAALSLWATGVLLARPDIQPTRREIARFGIAICALILARGLGPGFALVIVATFGLLARSEGVKRLAKQRDLWFWAAATVAALAMSGAWLVAVQQRFPVEERIGSGLSYALGQVPWYLYQSVGVFGQNDSALPAGAAIVWGVGLAVLFVAGLIRSAPRARLVAMATLLAGIGVSISAEGFSLPPIGFYWQGRYALPLLVGAFVVATCAYDRRAPEQPTLSPAWATWGGPYGRWVLAGIVGSFIAIHGVAFASLSRYVASRGEDIQSWSDFLTDPRWRAPVPFTALLLVYTGACLIFWWLLVRPRTPRSEHQVASIDPLVPTDPSAEE